MKNGELHELEQYVSSETFVQHNPLMGDGLDALIGYLDSLAARGESMTYTEIHLVIGSGSLVAALSGVRLAGRNLAVIDLFRVDDGRIVEHWDVTEEITPRDTWVNRGKF